MPGTKEGAAKARAARDAKAAPASQQVIAVLDRPKPDDAAQRRLEAAFGVKPQLALEATKYVCGRRPLKLPGNITVQPGEPVPEAAHWPRIESWLRSGALALAP